MASCTIRVLLSIDRQPNKTGLLGSLSFRDPRLQVRLDLHPRKGCRIRHTRAETRNAYQLGQADRGKLAPSCGRKRCNDALSGVVHARLNAPGLMGTGRQKAAVVDAFRYTECGLHPTELGEARR